MTSPSFVMKSPFSSGVMMRDILGPLWGVAIQCGGILMLGNAARLDGWNVAFGACVGNKGPDASLEEDQAARMRSLSAVACFCRSALRAGRDA